jgi:hypothetical protein
MRLNGELQQDTQLKIAAVSSVRKCAATMGSQAENLTQSLPELAMDAPLRAKALELGSALKDTSDRVMFELALLQTELSDDEADGSAAVQRLSGLEAAMLGVVADATDLVEQLENAAERDETLEPAFVLVIEAVGVLLQELQRAKSATAALGARLPLAGRSP